MKPHSNRYHISQAFGNLSVNHVMQKYLHTTHNVNTVESNDLINCHSPVVITVHLSHITYLQQSTHSAAHKHYHNTVLQTYLDNQ